jgi:hypothetical protein
VFQNGLVIGWVGWMGWSGVFLWRLQAIRRFRLTLNDDVKKTWLWGDFESTPFAKKIPVVL